MPCQRRLKRWRCYTSKGCDGSEYGKRNASTDGTEANVPTGIKEYAESNGHQIENVRAGALVDVHRASTSNESTDQWQCNQESKNAAETEDRKENTGLKDLPSKLVF